MASGGTTKTARLTSWRTRRLARAWACLCRTSGLPSARSRTLFASSTASSACGARMQRALHSASALSSLFVALRACASRQQASLCVAILQRALKRLKLVQRQHRAAAAAKPAGKGTT